MPQREQCERPGRRRRALRRARIQSAGLRWAAAVSAALSAAAPASRASDLYWDINGATAGASSGTTATGAWDNSTAFWSSDSTGNSITTQWLSGSNAVFAAGTNATGSYVVTVGSGQTVTASGIRVEEGNVTIASGNSNTFASPSSGTQQFIMDVASGSTLTINQTISAYLWRSCSS